MEWWQRQCFCCSVHTDDGDFIGFDGTCMKGRQELLHFIKCFSTNFLKVVVLFCTIVKNDEIEMKGKIRTIEFPKEFSTLDHKSCHEEDRIGPIRSCIQCKLIIHGYDIIYARNADPSTGIGLSGSL